MRTLFPLLLLLFFTTISLQANNGMKFITVNGTTFQAEHLEEGAINYYRSIVYEVDLVASRNGMYLQQEKTPVERCFLGNDEMLEEVTSDNYKQLIKKYLPEAKELHKRLGRLGFRFENVRYMVQYYNKFKA